MCKTKTVLYMMILAVVTILTVGCSGSSGSTKEGTEGLSYTQNRGAYYVTGYSGSDVNVVIPDTYNDIEVTGIDDEVFHQSDLQSVVFGKNVAYIGDNAFSGSSLLKSITLNSASIEFDVGAFYDCISLTDVTFKTKDYHVEVGYGAFESCDALEVLDLSGASDGSFDITAVSFNDNMKTLYLSKNITLVDVAGQRMNPNMHGDLFMCDAEIIYK